MKPNFEFRTLRSLFRIKLFAGSLVVLACASAFAFPPAPHHRLYGMVRNQWGDPINVAGAQVFLETTNGPGVTTTLSPGVDPGANYQLIVTMDAGTAPDLYTSTALKTSFPFRLKVKIGQVTYLPIEMAVSYSQIGQPAQSTRLDLTLGEDTDGDGLPDAWEYALIAALGGNLTLADIRPNDDSDGDGISNLNEYLAGTYPFDPNDGFRLSVVQVAAGETTLQFLAIRGRTYSIQASSDLKQWTPVSFGVVNAGTAGSPQNSYLSSDVRFLQIKVPFQIGAETNRYFRAMVQ